MKYIDGGSGVPVPLWRDRLTLAIPLGFQHGIAFLMDDIHIRTVKWTHAHSQPDGHTHTHTHTQECPAVAYMIS